MQNGAWVGIGSFPVLILRFIQMMQRNLVHQQAGCVYILWHIVASSHSISSRFSGYRWSVIQERETEHVCVFIKSMCVCALVWSHVSCITWVQTNVERDQIHREKKNHVMLTVTWHVSLFWYTYFWLMFVFVSSLCVCELIIFHSLSLYLCNIPDFFL